MVEDQIVPGSNWKPLSEHHPLCPYDGYKMTEIGSETHPNIEFVTYECPHCTHKAVVAYFESTGDYRSRPMVLCKCKGCKAIRAKKNPGLQEYFPDL